ncbi:hypothetical protein EON79_11920 [bacterium]|nr:MAG: hypothetical protein EON79_11920 [bacterium]
MPATRLRLFLIAACAVLSGGGCSGEGVRSIRATATAVCNDNTVEYDTRCSTMCSDGGGVKDYLIDCENR